MQNQPDQVMERAAEGLAAGQRGDRAAARSIFDELWTQIGGDAGDPLHRCAIAHWMADVQDDPHEELAWELRALDAADSVTDARAEQAGMAANAAALYPSLHLNLADVHLRLGNEERSRAHLALGRSTIDSLPDDGYTAMIREGLTRVEEQLSGAADAEQSTP